MANWYKIFLNKMARRGIIPRMDDIDEKTRNPYQPTNPLMNYVPIYGGERRKGYPTGISAFEDHEESPKDIPSEPVLMDQDPPPGEGANDERFVDEIDKAPMKNKPDPLGPHNMQQGTMPVKDIYNRVSRRSKIRNLDRV